MLRSTSWRTLVRLIPSTTARWSLVLGIGLVAGLLSAGHYLAFTNITTSEAVTGMVVVKLLVWLLWLPFVLATLEIAHRWPLESSRRLRRLAILFAAKIVVLTVYLGAYAVLLYIMARQPVTLSQTVRIVMFSHSTYFMLAFWAIVLVENALRKSIQLETRDQQARELELRLEQARLHSLHAQIRPHFMFNTLNAVSSLILRGNREQANEVVVAVADLLRMSLDRSKSTMLTVDEELAFVDHYVTLVKQRFHDRFTIRCKVAPDARSSLIPSFMLQNLVENTIKHAVENSEKPISLLLDIAHTDTRLTITASNNLPDRKTSPRSDEGYGLRSIRERLDAHFGERGKLEIDSRAPDQFTVRIELPASTETNAIRP